MSLDVAENMLKFAMFVTTVLMWWTFTSHVSVIIQNAIMNYQLIYLSYRELLLNFRYITHPLIVTN